MTITQCKWLAQLPLYLAILGLPACNVGCVQAYPSWMNDPEVKDAAIGFFEEADKRYQLRGGVHNPEVEFYLKQSLGARIVGVDATFELDADTPKVQP